MKNRWKLVAIASLAYAAAGCTAHSPTPPTNSSAAALPKAARVPGVESASPQSSPVSPTNAPTPDPQVALSELKSQIATLQGLVPDQAAVMSHLGYHFSNLWFAIDQENWPLADFYLAEVRSNLKWAVRVKPLRKDNLGKDVNVASLAEAVDNTQFTHMKKALDARDKKQCIKVYEDTLGACYACHKASDKTYLRPQIPKNPEVPVINFDPKATSPL